MDLNYVLSWIVGGSSAVGLVAYGVRLRRRAAGWLGVFAGVLLLLALGWWRWPEQAGIVAGAVWAATFLVPAWGQRLLSTMITRQRYGPALRVARALVLLHPFDGWRELPRHVRVLELLHLGDIAGAHALLSRFSGRSLALERFTTMQLLRAEGRWQEAAAWVESQLSPQARLEDPQTLLVYARALGELGRVEELARLWRDAVAAPGTQSVRVHLYLFAGAFTGRVALVDRLLRGPLGAYPDEVRAFWLATALQAAGDGEAASRLLTGAAALAEAGLRRSIDDRLARPVGRFEVGRAGEAGVAMQHALDAVGAEELRLADLGGPVPKPGAVTLALIGANLLVFLVSLPGGSTDPENLIRLGALVIPGEVAWWRIIMASLLHFGPLHLGLNLLGIWVLGREMERLWGHLRLAACYVAASAGANLMAVLLLHPRPDNPVILVGASGGVMGILGAALALALVMWRRTHLGFLRRQLIGFGVILGLQLVFDAATPEVSSTVHLAGASIGALVALALAGAARPARAGDGAHSS